MRLTLTYQEQDYISYTPEELLEADVPQEVISAAQTEMVGLEGKQLTVKAALSAAGGVEAGLVDTLDLTYIALSELARLVRAISTATTIAGIRDAAEPVSNLLEGWQDGGTVQLPLDAAGGVETVLSKAAERAAAITAAYEAQ